MATESSNWQLSDSKSRTLDVFYTGHGTKLFVKNGVLTEEKLEDPLPRGSEIAVPNPPDSLRKVVDQSQPVLNSQAALKYSNTEHVHSTFSSLFFGTPPGIHSSDHHGSSNCYSPSPPDSPRNVVDQSQTVRTSQAALKYYNAKHGTNFVLVDPIMSYGCIWSPGMWCHLNFTAKETTSESPQLFFAEITIKKTKYIVTACRILGEKKSYSNCEMCTGEILHPTSGFRQGLHRYKHRDLRPRRNGRVIPDV